MCVKNYLKAEIHCLLCMLLILRKCRFFILSNSYIILKIALILHSLFCTKHVKMQYNYYDCSARI